MIRFSSLILAGLVSFAAPPLLAQTTDGLPPSEEDVCDSLLGGPAGLFGLCNAFCEAQDCDEYPVDEQPRSCQQLLRNYLRQSDGVDPPCLAAACPCWTMDQLAAGTLLPSPVLAFCEVDGPAPPIPGEAHYDGAIYFSFTDGFQTILIENFVDGCEYFTNLPEGMSSGFLPTTPAENQACQNDVHALFLADMGGTEENFHEGCAQLP